MTTNNAGLMAERLFEKGMPYIIAAARAQNEHDGKIAQMSERHTLRPNTGTTWVRPVVDKLYAQAIRPDTRLRNPQRLKIIRVLKILPQGVTVQTYIPDELSRHMSRMVFMQFGGKAEAALVRYEDQAGLKMLNAAPGKLGTTSEPLNHTRISAAGRRIKANRDDPMNSPLFCVAHNFQLATLRKQFIQHMTDADWGEVSRGFTLDTFRRGIMGMIDNVTLVEDNHIDTNGNTALASVFGRQSLLLVNDSIRRMSTARDEEIGEGATKFYFRGKYAYGLENPSAWVYQIRSDATEPS